jgi:hypothetical protein
MQLNAGLGPIIPHTYVAAHLPVYLKLSNSFKRFSGLDAYNLVFETEMYALKL